MELVYRCLLNPFEPCHRLVLLFLLHFCLADLCSGESAVLKSPTISMWGLICDLSVSDVPFINVGTLVFEA